MKQKIFTLMLAFMAAIATSATFAATSLSIEVYDSEGDELKDAKVELMQNGNTLVSATTDRWGECDIDSNEDLTGDFQLRCSCEGYATQTKDITLPTDKRTFSFNLVATSATLKLTVQEDGVSQWYWEGARCVLSLDGTTVSETTTLSYSMGICEMKVPDPVEGKDYTLTVSKEGFNTVEKTLQFSVGETKSLTITLYKEGTEPPAQQETVISGNIYDQTTGNGLEGATVSLLEEGSRLGTATTDVEGDFTITLDSLIQGTFTLSVSAEGYEEATKTINVADGQSKSNDIGMKKASTEATINGEVKEEGTSKSIVGAELTLWQNGETVAKAINEQWTGYILTVPNVNDKKYTLEVTAEGYEDYVKDINLTVGANPLNISLKKTEVPDDHTVIRGRTVNPEGNTVRGCRVSLYKGEERIDYEFSQSDGTYELDIPEKLNGAYTLVASKSGYKDSSVEITITNGQAPETDITISKAVAVFKATVKDNANNKPVQGATIVLEQGWEEQARGTTDENGICEITIDGVSSDSYDLYIYAQGYDDFSDEIYLEDGENVKEFMLTPDASSVNSVIVDGMSIEISGKLLTIRADKISRFEIFRMDGSCVASTVVSGEKSFELVSGIYLISINGKHAKINMR